MAGGAEPGQPGKTSWGGDRRNGARRMAVALTVPYFVPRQSEACGVVTRD
jgi:hypothetical protein